MAGTIAVVGAGGQGRETADALEVSARTGHAHGAIAGYLDDDPDLAGQSVGGLRVLGTARVVPAAIDRLVLGVGYPETKWRMVQRLDSARVAWPTLVHPASSVGARAEFGRGAFIQAGAVLTTDVRVGEFATVNVGATVSHDCHVGNYATVCPGASLAGAVTLEEGAFVGIGASISQGVRVGAWSVIGAGAVVIRDVSANSVVAGVPACEIAQRAEGWWRDA